MDFGRVFGLALFAAFIALWAAVSAFPATISPLTVSGAASSNSKVTDVLNVKNSSRRHPDPHDATGAIQDFHATSRASNGATLPIRFRASSTYDGFSSTPIKFR